MATVEQADFQVPSIQEREELVLADVAPTAHRAYRPASAAERAATVAATVLGVDKQHAEDIFTGQLEAMGMVEVADDLAPIVHVTVGVEDDKGGIWTPSHVIRGHDKLTTTDGEAISETYVWPEMYVQRPAEWWNKTRPNGQGESELIKVPLQIVLADLALRGIDGKWHKQQAELAELIRKGFTPAVSVEGMPILAWAMIDADAIIGGTARPDSSDTANRFVQHEMDRAITDVACGPLAVVRGRRADLGRSRGREGSGCGFRAVMGQKQTA